MTSATTDRPYSGFKSSEVKRRDFLYVTAGTMAAVGAVAALWPFIDSMNPSADILALSSTREVNST